MIYWLLLYYICLVDTIKINSSIIINFMFVNVSCTRFVSASFWLVFMFTFQIWSHHMCKLSYFLLWTQYKWVKIKKMAIRKFLAVHIIITDKFHFFWEWNMCQSLLLLQGKNGTDPCIRFEIISNNVSKNVRSVTLLCDIISKIRFAEPVILMCHLKPWYFSLQVC